MAEPTLRRQQVVLYRQDSRRGQLVAAASPLAIRGGICLGMPLSEAKSLLKRSQQGNGSHQPAPANAPTSNSANRLSFHVFEHDPSADFTALETLADSLESFSPIIGLEQTDFAKNGKRKKTAANSRTPSTTSKTNNQPSSIFLDVTGLAHLFGDEYQLAYQLRLHCEKLGYLVRIAIANTIGMAWGAAKYHVSDSNSPALPHSFKEPVIIPPNDQTSFGKLPVAALRLTPATTDTLYQLGIETVEQVLRLPRPELAMRFGNEIHQRLDQASGQTEEPVIARHKPPEFSAEQLLDYPTNHRETIEVIIARLVTDICQQMRSRQRGALQWEVGLAQSSASPLEIKVSLFQPTASPAHIMPLIEMQLEQVLQPHTRKSRRKKRVVTKPASGPPTSSSNSRDSQAPATEFQHVRYTTIQIQEITVNVTSCVLLVEQQRQLFDENPRLDKLALAHLINRLSSRLGPQNVVYPTLLTGAQPEYSFRFRPLVDVHRRRSRRRTQPPRQSHVVARPLRIFNPAVKLNRTQPNLNQQLNSPAVTLENYQFKALSSALEFAANRHWGPERIETGWWRGRTVCRDYWRVETETQQQFWIYQNRRTQEWFLHGEF